MDKKIKDSPVSRINMQSNFSSMLYIITEQQALIGRLLHELLLNGTLTVQQLSRLTDINEEEDGMLQVYNETYKKFADYYLKTKSILEDTDPFNELPINTDPKTDKDPERKE